MARRLRVGLVGMALLLAASAQAQPVPSNAPPPRGMLPRQQEEMPGSLIGEAPGGGLPGADPFQLLVNSVEVQQELRLTQAQLERLQLAARNFRTQMQALTTPQPGASMDQARAAVAEQMMDTRAMIARELAPEQLARLQQIMLQLEGPCLSTVDVQIGQHLGLTDQQWRELRAVCSARTQQMRVAFQAPAPGLDECQVAASNRDRIERIRSRSDEQALALFSPQQRTQFAVMQGRHLNLEPPIRPECR